ncbi:hypothetical protein EON66_12190 [archaeon]|nr:MAG: hypothetical protein EON66_12190 [archaeon]
MLVDSVASNADENSCARDGGMLEEYSETALSAPPAASQPCPPGAPVAPAPEVAPPAHTPPTLVVSASDATLSCPYCFHTVCVACREVAGQEDVFTATQALGIRIGAATFTRSAGTQNAPGHRLDSTAPVMCASCGTRVGSQRGEDGSFLFSGVIVSDPPPVGVEGTPHQRHITKRVAHLDPKARAPIIK